MAEQDQDRTEEATPFKLKEAKNRGQVAKSLEVNSWFVIASFLLVLYLWGNGMVRQLAQISRSIFSHSADLSFAPHELILWLGQIFSAVLMIFAPMLIILVIIAVLMNLAQTGPVFSLYPLKPTFDKINPVSGFKRIFSLKTVYETIKSLVKLALLSTVVYFFIIDLLPGMLSYMHVDPDAYPFLFIKTIEDLLVQLVALLLVIALIDLIYSRREFSNKMRMSTRDIKDEVKRREGDPQVRAKMKELQREASKRVQSVKRVPEADVLITNPTHKAIAIKYDRSSMEAPRVIAKGAGDLALAMRQLARNNAVPIIENKPLARALFEKSEIDRDIPSMFYAEIARILVKIYATREQQRVTNPTLV